MGTEEVTEFLTPQRGHRIGCGNEPKPGAKYHRFSLLSRHAKGLVGIDAVRAKRSRV